MFHYSVRHVTPAVLRVVLRVRVKRLTRFIGAAAPERLIATEYNVPVRIGGWDLQPTSLTGVGRSGRNAKSNKGSGTGRCQVVSRNDGLANLKVCGVRSASSCTPEQIMSVQFEFG